MVNFEVLVRATPDKQVEFLTEVNSFRYVSTLGETLGCGCKNPVAYFPIVRPIMLYDISIIDGAADAFAKQVLGPRNCELPFKVPGFVYGLIKHLKPFRERGKQPIKELTWEAKGNCAVHVLGEKMDTNHPHITGKCPLCKKDTTVVWG